MIQRRRQLGDAVTSLDYSSNPSTGFDPAQGGLLSFNPLDSISQPAMAPVLPTIPDQFLPGLQTAIASYMPTFTPNPPTWGPPTSPAPPPAGGPGFALTPMTIGLAVAGLVLILLIAKK